MGKTAAKPAQAQDTQRVLLSGYYGFENLGDDLILTVLVRTLQEWGIEPWVLSDQPELTRQTLGVPAINRMNVPAIWQVLGKVDAFLSGGGGLFQDTTGWKSPLYYGGLIHMAAMRKVPVTVFGQGIGPLKKKFSRIMMKQSLKKSHLTVIRDDYSQALCRELGFIDVAKMADTVWMLDVSQWMNEVIAPQGIGISLRPWPQLTDAVLDSMAQGLAQWPGIHDKGVNLIDCQAGSDVEVLAKLEQRLKQLGIPTTYYYPQSAHKGIAQSEVVLGMRFHAIVVASLMRKPAICMAYDPKVDQLAQQLKLHAIPMADWPTMNEQPLWQLQTMADDATLAHLKEQARSGFSLLHQWLTPL